MKILYVGHLAIPIRDILTGKTEKQITGWPAYFQPVYRLIQEGNQVEFVFTSDLKDYQIKVDWLNAKQIVENVYYDKEKAIKFGLISRIIYRIFYNHKFKTSVKKAIKNNNYDFIYCQEINGYWGNVYANKYKVPCGVRIYGDTFYHREKTLSKYEYLKKHGILGLFRLNPKIVLLYKMKKSFMLTTADGTHGDLTYEILKPHKNKYDFYYWTTGVNKCAPYEENDITKNIVGIKYIVYPARIDTIKRQDNAIDVLSYIHKSGHKIHLFLVGQNNNEKQYNMLIDKINNLKLQDYVHFTGGVTQNQVKLYSKYSIATILTSDLSNRGNVFFELFSIGTPIISFDDGSLNDYIIHGVNGFLAKNTFEMSEYVISILENRNLRDTISNNALNTAKEKVISNEIRFNSEIELIKKYVYSNNNCLPKKM